MPKKQATSDRDIDLPDWADDVTPTDEVMKKFYAPTGTFKSGPIAVPDAAANALATAASPILPRSDKETRHSESSEEKASHLQSVVAAKEATIGTEEDEKILANEPFTSTSSSETPKASETSLLSPTPEIEQISVPEMTVPASSATDRAYDAPQETTVRAQTAFFEDFARKWRRYLYPGQLAVMRTLYEMTFARGTSECFTRYSEIAASTKMTRRNCINVMNSLIERGFVERLEVRNDATGKGIRLRVHPEPVL